MIRQSLTEREHQVFDGLARGQSLKAVAHDLRINYETAKTYARRAKSRYGVQTREEALLRWGRVHVAGRCWLCTSRKGAAKVSG